MAKWRTQLSWTLFAVYAAVTVLRAFAQSSLPELLQVALLTLVPLAFVFAHGLATYRLRDLLAFAAITLVVSNILENTSILTGFPFGHYYYTDAIGPKLFLVPILIGPAYLGTGYLSWALARILLGVAEKPLDRRSTLTLPLIASFLMVSWDLSFDPIASTIEHKWIWLQGGTYFGVPFTNYAGWFLTVLLFFALFAQHLRAQGEATAPSHSMPRTYWFQAILFYAAVGAGLVLNIATRHALGSVTDAAGMAWRTRDIYVTCGQAAIFTMSAFAILAAMRVWQRSD